MSAWALAVNIHSAIDVTGILLSLAKIALLLRLSWPPRQSGARIPPTRSCINHVAQIQVSLVPPHPHIYLFTAPLRVSSPNTMLPLPRVYLYGLVHNGG